MFLNIRNISKIPTLHSGVIIHAIDALSKGDLAGILLSVNSSSSITDLDGIAEIIKMKSGTVLVTISLAGYITQTLKVVIRVGRMTHLEIDMVKIG